MKEKFPLLRSLDPYHQRLGYLSMVVMSAVRSADSFDVLMNRVRDNLFEQIPNNSQLSKYLTSRIAPDDRSRLEEEALQTLRDSPASILNPIVTSVDWLYLHDLWMDSKDVYSRLGKISSWDKKGSRPIDLAVWLGFLTPAYEISEQAWGLRCLLEEQRSREGDRYNPFVTRESWQLVLYYLKAFLQAECLFPVLVVEMVEQADRGCLCSYDNDKKGVRGLLRRSIERLIETVGRPSRADEILEFRNISDFYESVKKNKSTQENYLRPRMEMLVDLGIIDRKKNAKKHEFQWEVTDVTRRASVEWTGLASFELDSEQFTNELAVVSSGRIFERPLKIVSDKMLLTEFETAYRKAGQQFGFTLASSIANMASAVCWAKGYKAEVVDFLNIVVRANKSPLGKFLHFSGGSRFDNDYRIRVDHKIVEELQKMESNLEAAS